MRQVISSFGLGTIARRLAGVRLGRLYQYSARPLSVTRIATSGNNDNLPTISIVTPSLNQGQFIDKTVDSVINQSYINLQYLIQDAGSTDATATILEAYRGHKAVSIVVESDEGQADALNRGFSRLSGDVMAYLNSDDMMLPGTLGFVGRFFRDNPSVDVIYGNRLIIDEHGSEIGRWILPYHDNEVIGDIDYVPQETLFWRKELWHKVGAKIDPDLRFAMDWDLIQRFIYVGACFEHVPNLFGLFRVHGAQKTQANFSSNGAKEMALIRDRYKNKSRIPGTILFKQIKYLLDHRYADKEFVVQTGIQ